MKRGLFSLLNLRLAARQSVVARSLIFNPASHSQFGLRFQSTQNIATNGTLTITNVGRSTSDFLTVTFSNNTSMLVHPYWLFFNSNEHFDYQTNQKMLDPKDVTQLPVLDEITVQQDGAMSATFSLPNADRKKYVFSITADWLLNNAPTKDSVRSLGEKATPTILKENLSNDAYKPSGKPKEDFVSADDLAKLPKVSYDSIKSGEKGVYHWLKELNEHGVVIVQGAPTVEDTVLDVASIIAKPIYTIYGESFEVAVDPEPINVAYSPVALAAHVDLVYYESPPGLQLLHCRQFDDSVEGGESTFIDGFYAAEILRRRNPEAFQTLCRVPATFQKVHYSRVTPVHLVTQRPHISVGGPNGDEYVTGVFWAPPFEGPLRVPEEDVQKYYEAYVEFSKVLQQMEDEEIPGLIKFRMRPGEISVFNNRRMLHGRRAFWKAEGKGVGNGKRILQGCYLNIDEYKSRFNVLVNTIGKESIDPLKVVRGSSWLPTEAGVKRVGNQYWL